MKMGIEKAQESARKHQKQSSRLGWLH